MTPKFVMTRKLVSGIVTFLVRKASVVIATTPHNLPERGSRGLDLSTTPAPAGDIFRALALAQDDLRGAARQPRKDAAITRNEPKMRDRCRSNYSSMAVTTEKYTLLIKWLVR
jgi:hypothetical protein